MDFLHEIGKITNNRVPSVHFIGIGGVGMYSLARLSVEQGIAVSGSDREPSDLTRDLEGRGVSISIGHREENIGDRTAVVYSLAIDKENPELMAARMRGIRTFSRAEYMGQLMRDYKCRIGVSGSHGKSTVTAMIAHIFTSLGKDPTVISGAPVFGKLPTAVGKNDYLVYEACEYRDSFLKFFPSAVVITNLELDHTDYFKSLDDIRHSFLMCINRAEDFAVLNSDDPNITSLFPLIDVDFVTVGSDLGADYVYGMRSFIGNRIRYSLSKKNSFIGEFELAIPGAFNVSNAALAIALSAEYGISPKLAGEALESFAGVARRMQPVGLRGGRAVLYDYAHHPTEIAAVINALRMSYGRLTVVFTPHTYTRTCDLWDYFVSSLSLADHVILTDIYPAREPPIPGVNSKRLAFAIGDGAIYAREEDVVTAVDFLTEGAIVVMGAGKNEKRLKKILDK